MILFWASTPEIVRCVRQQEFIHPCIVCYVPGWFPALFWQAGHKGCQERLILICSRTRMQLAPLKGGAKTLVPAAPMQLDVVLNFWPIAKGCFRQEIYLTQLHQRTCFGTKALRHATVCQNSWFSPFLSTAFSAWPVSWWLCSLSISTFQLLSILSQDSGASCVVVVLVVIARAAPSHAGGVAMSFFVVTCMPRNQTIIVILVLEG